MKRTPLKRSQWKRSAFIPKPKKLARKPKRSKTAIAKRREKNEWSESTADSKFSHYIRERDGRCVRCFMTEYLTCSHFWRRSHRGTRFDPKNCDALCAGPYSNGCHEFWENQKNLEYKAFKIKQLGQEEYDAMEVRARLYKNRKDAIAECKQFLGNL